MHARFLKFHIWIPYGKVTSLFFFLTRVMPLSGVMPLFKHEMEILIARYLKRDDLGHDTDALPFI